MLINEWNKDEVITKNFTEMQLKYHDWDHTVQHSFGPDRHALFMMLVHPSHHLLVTGILPRHHQS